MAAGALALASNPPGKAFPSFTHSKQPLPLAAHLPAVDLPERLLALASQRRTQQHRQLADEAKGVLVGHGCGGMSRQGRTRQVDSLRWG